jgi:branched-chain amino acid aminotransferase
MLVFLNGLFVPEDKAVVSVFDRGFLYGDGLFETIRIYGGVPFRWEAHWQRLEQGARALAIVLPGAAVEIRGHVDQLVQRNQMPEALLRLVLSRGIGLRGYSPSGAVRPTLVMSLHSPPGAAGQRAPRWRLTTASYRLPARDALARWKTCNRLPQILARAEAEAAGANEALLLNSLNKVAEASSSNLFWIRKGVVGTAPLTSGVLEGVTRAVVRQICQKLRLPTGENSITLQELRLAEGVFLSLSSWGIIEVVALDGQALGESPLTSRIAEAYAEEVRAECMGG